MGVAKFWKQSFQRRSTSVGTGPFLLPLRVFVIYFPVRKAYLLSPRTHPHSLSPGHEPLLKHSNWTIGVLINDPYLARERRICWHDTIHLSS